MTLPEGVWPDRDRPPWPFYPQRHAARLLGVKHKYLAGLANNPLTAFKVIGKTGTTLWMFHKDAVNDLVRQMARDA